jgi:DNA polymerase III subunit gamma/tau
MCWKLTPLRITRWRDVRDLRERILLAPILGHHKVVILDEAHMMSKSAFNALLKTLEEPPPHVIFIFATTEPERMPPTILSRTQHFRFRRLSEAEIVEKLQRILAGLGREAEPEALQLVARLADGAMRDAESLLDRLLTLEGPLTLKQTEDALGLPPRRLCLRWPRPWTRGRSGRRWNKPSTSTPRGLRRVPWPRGY